MSSRIGCGMSDMGRAAMSSRTKSLCGAPSLSSSATRLAAISRQASSVMIVTFSEGSTRRQTLIALTAPGVYSGSKRTERKSRMNIYLGFVHDVIHYFFQIPRFLEDAQLAIRTVAGFQDLANPIYILS